MRMTQHFGATLREVSGEIEVTSHRLLLRAGFIRPVAAGVFSYLPLAHRAMHKIEQIMRDEINAIGGQEVTMPVAQPADLWQESGRWWEIDAEMGRFADRGGRDMALAMTHEEALTDLARSVIASYRQLPRLVYHIQTKWRDDPRPRAGLLRAREFTMLDSYSLDCDEAGLDRQYRAHYQAYFNIFRRCGLADVMAVEADVGMMGGSLAHEFMALTGAGEDTIILCDSCGYTANRQVARFQKDTPTAEALLLMGTVGEGRNLREQFVFAVVRGDMDMNETKLVNAIKARALRPATEDEIRAAGAVPGYASPVGLGSDVLIVADDAVLHSPNLVAGANEEGYHLLNVNAGRDYEPQIVADIAAARAGDGCPACGHALRAERGVEVGNIFKLGTRYSEAMGCTFTAEDGTPRPVVMGSYGIGVGRLLQTVAELHHDEQGLIWPATIAPYHVYLVALRGGSEAADQLYADLTAAGVEVLYDDRDEAPGVKFNDADLIGLPVRVTAGQRSLDKGGAEVKLRREKEAEVVGLNELVGCVQERLAGLEEEIRGRLRLESLD